MSVLTQIFAAFSKPFKWWVVIAPWERGVLVRRGKTATELRPGIHFRIPFLDRIYVQSVRDRAIIETSLTHTTKDGRTVVLTYSIRFAIKDIVTFYDSVHNPETVLSTIAGASVGHYIADNEEQDVTLDGIDKAATAAMQSVVEWGLTRVSLSVMSLAKVRTYRFITNDYRQGAGLWNIEKDNSGER